MGLASPRQPRWRAPGGDTSAAKPPCRLRGLLKGAQATVMLSSERSKPCSVPFRPHGEGSGSGRRTERRVFIDQNAARSCSKIVCSRSARLCAGQSAGRDPATCDATCGSFTECDAKRLSHQGTQGGGGLADMCGAEKHGDAAIFLAGPAASAARDAAHHSRATPVAMSRACVNWHSGITLRPRGKCSRREINRTRGGVRICSTGNS